MYLDNFVFILILIGSAFSLSSSLVSFFALGFDFDAMSNIASELFNSWSGCGSTDCGGCGDRSSDSTATNDAAAAE